MRALLLAVILALGWCGPAEATSFTFSADIAGDKGFPGTVTGSFDGTLDGTRITDFSHIFVYLDGVAFDGNGSLIVRRFVNNDGYIDFVPDGAYISLDGTGNNFMFTDADPFNPEVKNYLFEISGYYDFPIITANSFPTGAVAFSMTSSLVVTQAAVPEPATWAMMVGGFGAMGFVLRRRRKMNTVLRFT